MAFVKLSNALEMLLLLKTGVALVLWEEEPCFRKQESLPVEVVEHLMLPDLLPVFGALRSCSSSFPVLTLSAQCRFRI